jgi:hypothetical protein
MVLEVVGMILSIAGIGPAIVGIVSAIAEIILQIVIAPYRPNKSENSETYNAK